ncbi:MAG: biopolymer transporter ExbD [Lentisphaeria bacterium]|mgnify:CR=1 FL=1|nr:biopolymer transporter ExbD [Lentisphaeria bacterium]
MSKIRPRIRKISEIEVGPFSDIAFLLIIFFILTTQIVRFTGAQVEIPSGQQAQEQSSKPKQITLNLSGESVTYSEGEQAAPISLIQLREKLMALNLPSLEAEKRCIIVDSKDDVPYHFYFKVVGIIDACGGILSIINEDNSESDGS